MMTPRIKFFPMVLLFIATGGQSLTAQAISTTRWTVPVEIDGRELPLAWVGGLNNPQLSEVDLNNDARPDLYIFDRTGDTQLTFLNEDVNGEATYTYAPEYTRHFPALTDWVLLRDYDGDGIMDIFAYSDAIVSGIRVYKGYYGTGNQLRFNRINFDNPLNILYFPLNTGGRTQIYVSNIDYPAIDDVDCDGDLDIVTFNLSGGYVELYRNGSIENGFGRDSLLFRLVDNCWGGFYESGISNDVDLADAPGRCATPLTGDDTPVTPRHAGSTLLTLDINGDDLRDLILGDVSYPELNLLINGGTCQEAWMNEQDSDFPSYDEPADIPLFPASFYVDVDHDGRRDLLAAPNLRLNAENIEVLWLYKNTATDANPTFELQTRTFLAEDMIDLGSGARPVPFDYNADGLLDIVVGNSSFFQPLALKDTRLFLFENFGTATAPAFRLVDSNYLDMQQYSVSTFDFTPAFGDLDGDGDLDAVVGEQLGQLFYLENTAGSGQPANFGPAQYGYLGIDIGQASVPQLIDLNRDGLPDLIVGERSGNINYFQNTGTSTAPAFNADPAAAPNVQFFGGVDARVPGFTTGYSSPWFVDTKEGSILFTGTQVGQLEVYGDIEDNLNGAFTLISEDLDSLKPELGGFTHPTLADWDADGRLDLLVGNYRGGLQLYRTNLMTGGVVPVAEPVATIQNLQLFPNPASDQLTLTSLPPETLTIDIFSTDGRRLLHRTAHGPQATLDVAALPTGVLLVRVTARAGVWTGKVIKE